MPGFIYILSNSTHTVIYTGMTNNLLRRVDEHRRHLDLNSFTAKRSRKQRKTSFRRALEMHFSQIQQRWKLLFHGVFR